MTRTLITKLIDVLEKYAHPQSFYYDKGQEARKVLKEIKNYEPFGNEPLPTDEEPTERHESYSIKVRG